MSMNDHNPFQAPAARVADPGSSLGGRFLPEGRKVAAGNGWLWIVQAWELFKQSPGMWIGVYLIFTLMVMAMSLIPLAGMAVNLFLPVFMGGIMLGCKALEEGEELQINHLFAGFSDHLGPLVLVGVAYLVGMVAIVVMVGITAALLIPLMMASRDLAALAFIPVLLAILVALLLLIPMVMAIWFAPPLIVFHALPPIEAMKASFVICLKNFVPFLVYGLALAGLSIVAILPCFLGFLVLGPVIMASIYTSYRDMFIQE
ncbi:MAG: hypothetical protein BWY57_02323 [Betaproteobacteria bacterium ADurb.Bin341]|nr:MAG: hypothetical protein BWY57_02323 [Betaproteobacteria bacterium ADurb.Bin341]